MKFLFDFAKDIILFTVFMNLWEMLIPKGKYSAYISLVLSFVLIAVIINPIAKLFSNIGNENMKIDFEYNVAQREISIYGEKYYGLIENEFSKRLKDEINNNNIASIRECDAQIYVDEDGILNIEKIIFYTDDTVITDVKQKIARYIGIDENRVFVKAG